MYELHRDIGTIHQPAAWTMASTCRRKQPMGHATFGVIVLLSMVAAGIMLLSAVVLLGV